MINFTDEELKHIHDVLADDIQDSTSKLNAINKSGNKEAIAIAIASGLYSSLLNCAETGLTAIRKIILALDDESSKQEDLRETDKALGIVENNRKYLAKIESL